VGQWRDAPAPHALHVEATDVVGAVLFASALPPVSHEDEFLTCFFLKKIVYSGKAIFLSFWRKWFIRK
jgi:hypothetical protein